MKISIYPYIPDSPNKYIDRMVEAIKYTFPDAAITSFPRTRNIFTLRDYDFVWINWFENLSQTNKFKESIIKIAILSILKLFGVKIVSTLHNRVPHESDGSLWDRLMFYITFRFANKILILSSDSKNILKKKYGNKILRKVALVPHPTYDCTPKNITNNNPFSILLFGNLRPYKNIELIFELAKSHPQIPFTIAGSALTKDYEDSLKAEANQISNITLISHFLTKEEIDKLIESNSILILPYDLKSSLNSGVIIHAICKKINVIVPQIGTVNQLKNKNMIFSYSYNSPEGHIKELNRMIELAKNEYNNDIGKFNNRIELLYNEVMANQSPKALSPLVSELFT